MAACSDPFFYQRVAKKRGKRLGGAAARLDAGIERQRAAIGALASCCEQDALGIAEFGHNEGLRLGAALLLPHWPEPR